MKEAIVVGGENESLTVQIQDSPIPEPGPTEILIRVVVAGTNPKDWKGPIRIPAQNRTNTGDDLAGVVHSVGSSVTEFRPGDRVAALHRVRDPKGAAFAEYALSEEHSTFFLPEHVSFEEGATIPLAAMTAAIGLFCRLEVPEPWCRDEATRKKVEGGVVVYGAASAVGAFVIKLLIKSDIHPIIAIAGRGRDFVESLIDRGRGDVIIDYRRGDDAVVEGIRNARKADRKLRYAFDAVSEHGSWINIGRAIEEDGYLTTVTPGMPCHAGIEVVLANCYVGRTYEGLPEQIHLRQTHVGTTFAENKDFATAWFRLFTYGLKDGWLSGHPYRAVPGGLNGVQEGLEGLRDGKASGFKYVYRIAETKGIE